MKGLWPESSKKPCRRAILRARLTMFCGCCENGQGCLSAPAVTALFITASANSSSRRLCSRAISEMKMRNVLTGCDFSKSATTTAGIPFSFFWAGLTGIADLQDFIDRSLEVPGEAEFTLVYGLLYDQIDRLPIGWAQKAVIRLFERTEAIISGVCVFYWSSKLAIRVPPSPRSISYIKPLASLRELLQRTRLKWRNFSNVRGFFSAAIWVNFCTSEQDLRAWQETLGVDPKNFGLPSRYYAFPLYRMALSRA